MKNHSSFSEKFMKEIEKTIAKIYSIAISEMVKKGLEAKKRKLQSNEL